MRLACPNSEAVCRPEDIGKYLDGEMAAEHELELEMHLAGCGDCRDELNHQKALTRVLDDNLDLGTAPELPENFSRRISAAAVSDIGGIRTPRERWTAIAICILLMTFAVAALGGAMSEPLRTATAAGDQSFAILSAVGHFFYNLGVGVVTLLRPISGSVNTGIYAMAVAGVLVFTVFKYGRRSNNSN